MLFRHSTGIYQENKLTCNSSRNTQPPSSQLAEPLWTDPDLLNGIDVHKQISKQEANAKMTHIQVQFLFFFNVLVCCLNALNSNQTQTPDDMKTQTDKECRKIPRKIPPDKNYKCYKKYSSTVPAQCHLKLVKVIEVRIF